MVASEWEGTRYRAVGIGKHIIRVAFRPMQNSDIGFPVSDVVNSGLDPFLDGTLRSACQESRSIWNTGGKKNNDS